MARTVLVSGATGKQGGAVINSLIAANADLDILAVTRDPSSASAQRLLQKSPRVRLVKGDLNKPAAIFESAQVLLPAGERVWGVFSVQMAIGAGVDEAAQGKNLVDAALAAGVRFFVYSSVDRHGDRSPANPTDIPHFIHKHEIEQHLIRASEGTDMRYHILRPVAFMDNLTDDFPGRVFVTGWRNVIKEKSLQVVAVSDIGVFAARAFMSPEEHAGKAVSLAGDELTFDEFVAAFKRATGREPPAANGFLSSVVMWMVKDLGYMYRWFYNEGYAADIDALRRVHPGLKTMEEWVRTESAYKTAA